MDIDLLARRIDRRKYTSIYAIPRGGLYVGIALSTKLNLPLVDKSLIHNRTLIVDDLVDSGATRQKYMNNDFACLHIKQNTPLELIPNYYAETKEGWVEYFWEKNAGEQPAEDIVTRMLQIIGENPNRPGLKDTPARVAKMWKEIFRGYNKAQAPKITVFANDGSDGFKYDTMLKDEGYFFSHCEHHAVPFFGQYYFAYIPDKFLVGASKIGRAVDYFSAKLQIAERLVIDIVSFLDSKVQSKGMILTMTARHLCKEMRGVKKFNSPFEATAVTGYFAENKDGCKDEFIARIR
jgi:GTP cyclohydrolase I